MVTENHFSKEIQKHFEDKQLIQSSITTRKQRKPTKQSKKRSAIPSETIPSPPSPPLSPTSILSLDLSSSSTSVHDITQIAEILADLEKDTISPAHRNFETTSNTETTSGLNFCETDKTSNRLVGKFVSSSAVNLSRRNITSAEIELLEKGLRFVPTLEKIDKWQSKKDLEKLRRDIRLKIHYLDEPSPAFSETPAFKVPPSWTPLIRDTQLEMYLSELEEEILKIDEAGKNYPNLTKAEREALQDLMYDKNIVIKPADKGSAIVTWCKQDYLKECELQLSNKSVYEEVNRDPLQSVTPKIRNILLDMLSKKEIDKKIIQLFVS